MIEVEISYGELFDKISILEIKKNKLKSLNGLKKVSLELSLLKEALKKSKINLLLVEDLKKELKIINTQLWNIEDKIREKESEKNFDDEFIKLARNVYITNDKRSSIKNKINISLKSKVFEVKSYKNY
tara:strand:- start:95 stop:478 length:384 start_codon:yes stop_codon:yes gene_type:complete